MGQIIILKSTKNIDTGLRAKFRRRTSRRFGEATALNYQVEDILAIRYQLFRFPSLFLRTRQITPAVKSA